jgi:hypothetical protein
MKFEPNPDFDGALRAAVAEQMPDVVRTIQQQFEAALSEVAASHRGKPVDDVRVALRARLEPTGVQLDHEAIDEIATAISEGSPLPQVSFRTA